MSDAAFYAALVPLATARLRELRDAPEAELSRLEFDTVELADDDERGPHVVVLFRDPERPGCRFGWRWSWVEGPKPEEVDFAASVLATNLEEDILADGYGLPAECAEDETTWF